MNYDINMYSHVPIGLEFEIFDLINNDLSTLEIVENSNADNCYVRSKDRKHCYKSFILEKNTRTTTLCDLQFFKSSTTHRYIPRPTFRKINNDGADKTSKKDSIIIRFNDSEIAQRFWDFISFLGSFKEVVDTGEFNRKYRVETADYVEFLKTLDNSKKVQAVAELFKTAAFSPDNIKSFVYQSRKVVIKSFLWLLRNKKLPNGKTSRQYYQEKYKLTGEEAVWHHFLSVNDWILGLNADIRFISKFIDEAKVGNENSDGKGSPKVDMLGISNYTTLIELKTSDTPIFKIQRGNNSRANTWEFSSEFIAGISQCLGQKAAFDEAYMSKTIIAPEDQIVSKDEVLNADVKVIFIIGCRYKQFPHNKQIDNQIKSKTFELFRRNNRNVEIITYDEVFERAYHIVMSEKIPDNWFDNKDFDIK